jgi:hypothetical protein
MTKQQVEMNERCFAHARHAARHAVMKGLDPAKAALAFQAEAFVLSHGINLDRAIDLVKHINSYALEILQAQALERCAAEGCSEAEMAELGQQARNDRNSLNTPPVIRGLVPAAQTRAALMGAAALPPSLEQPATKVF